jgi:DNA-directed RNA polymerase subunit F
MILKNTLYLGLLLFLSCQTKIEGLELPEDKLVTALADAHIIEGALLSVFPSKKDSLRELYYQQIYEIHGISEQAFEHDVEFLKINPKMMDEVYEKVLKELDLKGKEDKKELNEEIK